MEIYRRKSTLGYQSLLYVVALFSATLWMYYAVTKGNSAPLISINSAGYIIEIIYLNYATYESRKSAAKQISYLNVCLFSFILLLTHFQFQGQYRVEVLGWICVAISVCVFAAPLSILFQVLQTKIVEYMPFSLSFFLTSSAIVWFAYGLSLRDWYIAIPNVFGFVLGLLQMLLYGIYRNNPNIELDEKKIPEHIINMVIQGGTEVHPVNDKTCENDNKNVIAKKEDEKEHERISMELMPEEQGRVTMQLDPSPPILVVCAA